MSEHLRDLYCVFSSRPRESWEYSYVSWESAAERGMRELLAGNGKIIKQDQPCTDQLFLAWALDPRTPEETLAEWQPIKDPEYFPFLRNPLEDRKNQLTETVVKLTEELVQKELAELGELPNLALAQWGSLRVALSSFGTYLTEFFVYVAPGAWFLLVGGIFLYWLFSSIH